LAIPVNKSSENKSLETVEHHSGGREAGQSAYQFKDERPETAQLQQLQKIANEHSATQPTIQQKKNNTGLPDNLKSGIENLSGFSMDDVKVHRNSDKPAQLNAHAYAQGTDIHLAPGQEKHLPHEAWHVVQQKQGRVQPTKELKGKVNINDDSGLEKEADVMGAKALQVKKKDKLQHQRVIQRAVIQRRITELSDEFITNNEGFTKDLLKHAIQNLSPEELSKFTEHMKQPISNEALDKASSENLIAWYKNLMFFSGEDKKMTSTLHEPDTSAPTTDEALTLKKHLGTLCTQMKALVGQTEFYKTVFGPDCNVTHIDNVYSSIWKKAYRHFDESSKFVEKSSETSHNDWVKTGGMASEAIDHITVSKIEYGELLKGSPEGFAVVVHEFSHKATPATVDIAYSMGAMEKLPESKRVKNAENYAQAYLQFFHKADPRRLYDPSKVIPTVASSASTPNEHKERRLSLINSKLVETWNLMDNAYSFVKEVHQKGDTEWHLKPAFIQLINFAIYPHTLDVKLAPDPIRALIEDRTRQLMLLQVRKNLVTALKSNGIEKDRIEAEGVDVKDIDMLSALAIKSSLHMNYSQADTFLKNFNPLRK